LEIFRNLPDLYIFFSKFVFIFCGCSVSDLNPTLSRQRHTPGLAGDLIVNRDAFWARVVAADK